jgi:hypothetical protein
LPPRPRDPFFWRPRGLSFRAERPSPRRGSSCGVGRCCTCVWWVPLTNPLSSLFRYYMVSAATVNMFSLWFLRPLGLTAPHEPCWPCSLTPPSGSLQRSLRWFQRWSLSVVSGFGVGFGLGFFVRFLATSTVKTYNTFYCESRLFSALPSFLSPPPLGSPPPRALSLLLLGGHTLLLSPQVSPPPSDSNTRCKTERSPPLRKPVRVGRWIQPASVWPVPGSTLARHHPTKKNQPFLSPPPERVFPNREHQTFLL